MPLLFLAQNMIPASMLPENCCGTEIGRVRLLFRIISGRDGGYCYNAAGSRTEKRFYSLFVKMEAETGVLCGRSWLNPCGCGTEFRNIWQVFWHSALFTARSRERFSAMEKFLTQKEVALRDMVWVAREDVLLLAEMAMAGIEMLPRQERLSWQQIKAFYILLCR